MLMSSSDRSRLEAISAQRAAQAIGEGGEEGYRIGPDDLLDIRIPDLLDPSVSPAAVVAGAGKAAVPVVAAAPLFARGIRVGADGNINIPFLGLIRADGLTPRALEGDIARHLVRRGILRQPQVNVLIAEYRNHVVAVIGSVERPGLYPITRPGATVADLIWTAGGPSKDAGRIVQFSPAGDPAPPQPLGSSEVDAVANKRVPSDRLPIRIDLDVLLPAAGEQTSSLNPQVRRDDVISVPPAGAVQVDGWVQKPGSYPVNRNLMLSGAIAAAGGTSFATDRSRVLVKRVLSPGEERTFTVDLDAVAQGRATDFPIADGDVVYLPASGVRVVPWGVWQFVTTIFRFGFSAVAF